MMKNFLKSLEILQRDIIKKYVLFVKRNIKNNYKDELDIKFKLFYDNQSQLNPHPSYDLI